MSFWDWFHPKPKPPTTTACYVTVCTADRAVVPGLRATLEVETNPGTLIVGTQDPERVRFAVPSAQIGHGAYLRLTAKGYVGFVTRLAVWPDMGEVIMQAVPTLLPIRTSGTWFETSDGQPWSQRGCSDFRLYARFLDGEDIRPVLEQRRALGFNQLRILGTCDLMFRLWPNEHPDYFTQIGPFLTLVGSYSLRVEWTVFADATRVMPSLTNQQAFYAAVCETLRPFAYMVFVELVNENEVGVNTIQTDAFTKPDGLIASHGSNGADSMPVTPVWDYASLHPARPPDWVRKCAKNPLEDIQDAHGVPGTANEMCRPNQGRGPIPSDHREAVAGGGIEHNGTTFHSEAGKQSVLLDGAELACAEGAQSGVVSLDYRRGTYTRGGLGDFPLLWRDDWASRAYGRILGNRACVVVCQPTAAWQTVPVNGWRVVRDDGDILELER